MHRIWCLVLLLCSLAAASERTGAGFLLIWPGGRSTAMAGAFSALADDATACYYNQAGLAFMNGLSASLQHCNWLPGLDKGMYYEYAGVTKAIGRGTVGLDFVYFTTGETYVTSGDGTPQGTYRAFDMAAGLNYGLKLRPDLGVGAGGKFIYSYLVAPWVWDAVPDLSVTKGGVGLSFALDLGMLYKPSGLFSFAAALQNIGPNIKYSEPAASEPLPYTLRLGLKVSPIETRTMKGMITADITKVLAGMFADPDKTSREQLNYELKESWKGVGLELGYFDIVFIRGGYFSDYEGRRNGFTYGGGVKYKGLALDVGIDQDLYRFKSTNQKFSLSYKF